MQTYVIVNYNSNPPTPPSPETLQAWGSFFESIKENVVDGGRPFSSNKAVVKDGASTRDSQDTAVAYYIIKADSLDEAAEIAKRSPFANIPGCEIRVYETRSM